MSYKKSGLEVPEPLFLFYAAKFKAGIYPNTLPFSQDVFPI
jgi:hypothetical protein